MAEKERIIQEEQDELNKVIKRIDRIVLEKNAGLDQAKLDAQKAKDQCLPDTYGAYLDYQAVSNYTRKSIEFLYSMRDELYGQRLELEGLDEDHTKPFHLNLHVGLHELSEKGDIIICTWLMPVCRNFFLDHTSTHFESEVLHDGGFTHTIYDLLLNRRVKTRFTTVKEVVQYYPVSMPETSKSAKDRGKIKSSSDVEQKVPVIADEFLQELLNRRDEIGFRNIVFSIQKIQGDIIRNPFQQNLIVQGCAGSGKSMIMLHRLPIVLYDNPNSLVRSSVFVITPSREYIHMAEQMLEDLEIWDLPMGTLNDYYNHVLLKYNVPPDKYGKPYVYEDLTPEQETFVYSEKLIQTIAESMQETVGSYTPDLREETWILGINPSKKETSGTPFRRITDTILMIQEIINKQYGNKSQYHKVIREVIEGYKNIERALSGRRSAILRQISQQKSEYNQRIVNTKKELSMLNKATNAVAYQNRVNELDSCFAKLTELQKNQYEIETDQAYFDNLSRIGGTVSTVIKPLIIPAHDNMPESLSDDCIQRIGQLIGCYYMLEYDLAKTDEKYTEYIGNFKGEFQKLSNTIEQLKTIDYPLLSENQENRLQELIERYKTLQQTLPDTVYADIMKLLGQNQNESNEFPGLSCSPYIYLQIMYQFRGAPNAAMEQLITVDEAQTLAREEYRLIQNVNSGRVVLNMFGDIHQHVEDRKGLNSWDEVKDLANFKIQSMNQNYRNAKQITDYCTEKFGIDMQAISPDGGGVYLARSKRELNDLVSRIMTEEKRKGLSAIIFKTREEALTFINTYSRYRDLYNDLTVESGSVHSSKWNLLLISGAKGLEFRRVLAFSGRMTENEKYIAYTRALDKLFIFDGLMEETVLPKETVISNKILQNDKNRASSAASVREEPISGEVLRAEESVSEKGDERGFPDSKLRQYLESVGADVRDYRRDTKRLWIVGDRKDIMPIAKKVCNIFKISGKFGTSADEHIVYGWYTTSEK